MFSLATAARHACQERSYDSTLKQILVKLILSRFKNRFSNIRNIKEKIEILYFGDGVVIQQICYVFMD